MDKWVLIRQGCAAGKAVGNEPTIACEILAERDALASEVQALRTALRNLCTAVPAETEHDGNLGPLNADCAICIALYDAEYCLAEQIEKDKGG